MQIPINQRKRVKGKSFFSLFGTDHPPTALGRSLENAPNFKAEYVRYDAVVRVQKTSVANPEGFRYRGFLYSRVPISIDDGTE